MYASGGYYGPGDPVAAVEQEYGYLRELGFKAFKMKIAGAEPQVDLARVEAARRVIGPRAPLAVDANGAWKDTDEAMSLIEKLARHRVWWVEEPLGAADRDGWRALERMSPIRLAGGETLALRGDWVAFLDALTDVVVQPDACVVGGIARWLAVAGSARMKGMPIFPHWNAEVHAHLARARLCRGLEFVSPFREVYDTSVFWREKPVVEDGSYMVHDRPGLGVSLDREALAEHVIG